MVSKGTRAEVIILTELIVLLDRDPSKLVMLELVLTGILLGHTLYHDSVLVGPGLHPHLTTESIRTTPAESTIFVQSAHKVLGLVKRCMACVDIDHELLMGGANRDVESLPRREPSSDIFRIWGIKEKPLVGMLLAVVATTYFDSRSRWLCSQDKIQCGKDLGKRLRVDRGPCKATVCMRGQMVPGCHQK